MITQQISNESIRGKLPSVKCKLCQAEVKKTSQIVKLGTNYGVICSDCAEELSHTDRELIYNMCVAFGGYYGKLRTPTTNNYKIIKSLAEQYQINNRAINVTSLDVHILHRAFLYGISPSQIVQGLKILSD
jgi:predicted amidophosphoribosyltransferase